MNRFKLACLPLALALMRYTPLERIGDTQKKPVPFEVTRDGLEPCSVGYASFADLQPVAAR